METMPLSDTDFAPIITDIDLIGNDNSAFADPPVAVSARPLLQ